jgi:hypothetical protein
LPRLLEGYSPNCLEGEFSEVRLNGILGSSPPARNTLVTSRITHLGYVDATERLLAWFGKQSREVRGVRLS